MSSSSPKFDQDGIDDGKTFDVLIVGAGFAGCYQLHLLREAGFSVKVLEIGSDLGGTWFFNRYPGARCDVESMQYCYSFSEELTEKWVWSERYPSQKEILSYIFQAAEMYGWRRDIQFNTRVVSVAQRSSNTNWIIRTEIGEEFFAKFCIFASGNLSSTKRVEFEGLETFKGNWYHSANWPVDEINLVGKRVGIVGTGSTGIQLIPVLAEVAAHLTIFQRTANFSIPAHNSTLSVERQNEVKAEYAVFRDVMRNNDAGMFVEVGTKSVREVTLEEAHKELERRWQIGGAGQFASAFTDTMTDENSNKIFADFVRSKIRKIVEDQDIAEKLCPVDHPFGSKRICVDSNYFQTFNRENVSLVDLRATPFVKITEDGIMTSDDEYELDVLIFAIGFDAMTGALAEIEIFNKDGKSLKDKWVNGPETFLGLATSGFPNLFFITGPGSPSVLSNMLVSIEQHVEWVTDCLIFMRGKKFETIDVVVEAEINWVDHVNEVASKTLFSRANSWFNGANIPGKKHVFMPYLGGVGRYRRICDDVATRNYEGFIFRSKI